MRYGHGHQAVWRRGVFWTGAAVGLGLATLAFELPYVNWRSVAAPIDTAPLVVRQDAKGDGRFGSPRSGGRRHRGVDLMAPLGSPVRAIRSGVVVEVGAHRGLGRFLLLEHRRDLTSLYAHLATVDVAVGQRVRQGEVIGTVGKTGNARNHWITPHVHLELVRRGEPMDPVLLGLQAVTASSKEQLADGRPSTLAQDGHPERSRTDGRGGD